MRAESVIAGIDLGGAEDCSALVLLARNGTHWLLWSHQWITEHGRNKWDRAARYKPFIDRGELTVYTPDEDMAEIVGVLQDIKANGLLAAVGMDPYGAKALAERIGEAVGIEPMAVPQGWRTSPGIDWIERRVTDGTLHHDGNAMLKWNLENAVVERKGNARAVEKSSTSGKIDGVAALITAACVALVEPKPRRSVYERAADGSRASLFL